MKKEKRNKGITLIALVITIIVMLILVGVSVNVALNGGLFDTAKTAASETQIASEKETLQAAVIGSIDGDLKVASADTLKGNLPAEWTVVAADAEGVNAGTYTVTSSKGNEFTVYEDGTTAEGTLNEYGFYYNKEYICRDFFSSTYTNKVTTTILEDGTFIIKTYQELDKEEGSSLTGKDISGTTILTVESLEYNREYTATGILDSQYTFIVDDNGNLSSEGIISKDNMAYSDKIISIGGGLLDSKVSEDGKSLDVNEKTFAIEK